MKTLIAIPCMDMVHAAFARSLVGLRLDGEVQFTFIQGSLVYDGRNRACQVAEDGGFDRVLWLDSDMVFEPDLFERLSADLDEGRRLVAGLCFGRKPPIRPAAYRELGMRGDRPVAEPIEEWPEVPFTVEGVGMAAVLVETSLLREVRERFGLPFSPILGFGEDFSFCLRARECGAALWVDPRVKLGHCGQYVFGEKDFQRGG